MLPLFLSLPSVSAPSGMFNSTVNYMLTFFDSTMGNLTVYAMQIARILALIGIVFCGVKVAFGTQEVRKGLVGIIVKLFMWFLVMNLYPGVCTGIRTLAMGIGKDAAPVTSDALTKTFTTALERYENAEEYMKERSKELARDNLRDEVFKNALPGFNTFYILGGGLKKLDQSIINYYGGGEDGYYGVTESPAYVSTLKQTEAIKSVMTQMPSGEWVLDLMMPIVDDNGKVVEDWRGNPKYNNIFSCDALFNTVLLATQIMYENQMAFDVVRQWAQKDLQEAFDAEMQKKKKNSLTEEEKRQVMLNKSLADDYKTKLTDFPVSAFMRTALVMFSSIIAIVLSCICLIQYVMCIIEYSICTSFSIVILPCMLMDELKDYAVRTIGMLLNQAMKLAMITLMMFFNAFTYMQMSDKIISDSSQFGLIQFAFIVFTSLITFALVANAPKLATAILTGQPQMSMGEFVGAAAAIAGGAALGAKGASMVNTQAQQGARFTSNRVKDVNQMVSAGYNAFKESKQAGANTVLGSLQAMKAAGKTGASLAGRHAKEMGQTWMNGGGSILRGDAFRNYDSTPVKGTGKMKNNNNDSGSKGGGNKTKET